MSAAQDTIAELVEKFDRDAAYYRSKDYNETQVRIEFINPFFRALGWNVDDSRHVIHEDRVRVGKQVKHPDYGFMVDRSVRFYVEAKAPHVDVKQNTIPAFQVRRYGWSQKLPASVLTDFEEFSIYDCRVRPNSDDAPNMARLRYYTYTDYVAKWDEISDLLSYDAVTANRLDEWVRGEKTRGIEAVDDAFLSEMEAWRVLLAKDIALHNPDQRRYGLELRRHQWRSLQDRFPGGRPACRAGSGGGAAGANVVI